MHKSTHASERNTQTFNTLNLSFAYYGVLNLFLIYIVIKFFTLFENTIISKTIERLVNRKKLIKTIFNLQNLN